LAQPHRDIEIILSDNASDENYKAYVASLSDTRIVYYRHAAPVPVTENWQKALWLATGDYVLMLGDDDALTPQFSEIVLPHLSPKSPDVAYLAAYHYCYPGVMPGAPAGYMAAVKCEFLHGAKDAFMLETGYARELASAVLDFRHRFNFNGQHFLLKRSFAEEFSSIGGLYQGPYPDFFAAIAVFHRARSILVLPRESVIIGISPRSFGAYYFSHRQKEGYKFLDNENLSPDIRGFVEKTAWPGDMNNTNWLIAAEMARRALSPSALPGVNIDRYRFIQINSLLQYRYLHGHAVDAELSETRTRLSPGEAMIFDSLLSTLDLAAPRGRDLLVAMLGKISLQIGQYPEGSYTILDPGPHKDIADAIGWLKSGQPAPPARPATGRPITMRGVGGKVLRTLFPNHAGRIIQILKRGPLGILQGVARRIRRILPRPAPETGSQLSPAQQLPVADHGGLRIVVKRGTEECVLTPGLFDDFDFRHGDELSVAPIDWTANLIKTPEGNVHILTSDGRGIRVPSKMEFASFRGYLIPEHLIRLTGAGSETFEELGNGHIANYRKYVGLKPGMSFLEIGSGIGRDALHLIDALGPAGSYIGIDVQRESIVWCQKNISRDHPSFQFYHFNAVHELHNPLGSKTTLDYPLPAPDRSIDRIGLQSLLTHIFEEEIVHYLSEISRVLKADGLAYVTFLLYSEEIVAASRINDLTPYGLRFEHSYGDGCYVNSAQYPTGGVAYTDEAMQRMVKRAGLRLARPYLKGTWSGYHADADDDGQDVAILGPALDAGSR
jgi:SAM-dependent methyltransferase/glycosyltransferase involved in cell wall biosynthesis